MTDPIDMNKAALEVASAEALNLKVVLEHLIEANSYGGDYSAAISLVVEALSDALRAKRDACRRIEKAYETRGGGKLATLQNDDLGLPEYGA